MVSFFVFLSISARDPRTHKLFLLEWIHEVKADGRGVDWIDVADSNDFDFKAQVPTALEGHLLPLHISKKPNPVPWQYPVITFNVNGLDKGSSLFPPQYVYILTDIYLLQKELRSLGTVWMESLRMALGMLSLRFWTLGVGNLSLMRRRVLRVGMIGRNGCLSGLSVTESDLT